MGYRRSFRLYLSAKRTPKSNACVQLSLLLQRDSATGASICASTTLGALLRIDRILLALRDSSYGTFVDTCAACNTIITNYVCHNLKI